MKHLKQSLIWINALHMPLNMMTLMHCQFGSRNFLLERISLFSWVWRTLLGFIIAPSESFLSECGSHTKSPYFCSICWGLSSGSISSHDTLCLHSGLSGVRHRFCGRSQILIVHGLPLLLVPHLRSCLCTQDALTSPLFTHPVLCGMCSFGPFRAALHLFPWWLLRQWTSAYSLIVIHV